VTSCRSDTLLVVERRGKHDARLQNTSNAEVCRMQSICTSSRIGSRNAHKQVHARVRARAIAHTHTHTYTHRTHTHADTHADTRADKHTNCTCLNTHTQAAQQVCSRTQYTQHRKEMPSGKTRHARKPPEQKGHSHLHHFPLGCCSWPNST